MKLMIGTKLQLCFGLLIAMMVAASGLTYLLSSKTAEANEEAGRTAEIVTSLKDSFLAARGARAIIWYYMATGDEQAFQDQAKSFATYDAESARLSSLVRTETGRQAFNEFAATVDAYKATAAKLIEMRRSGLPANDPAYLALAAQAVAEQKAYAKANDTAAAYFQSRNQAFQAAAAEALDQMQLWPSVIAVCSILIALACVWLMNRSIVHPLVAMTGSMAELAAGKLEVAVPGAGRADELGSMAKAVQVFKDAAIENRRLDAEAKATRESQAQNRERQAAIDNAKAEDLRVFVHAVDEGFEALAQGDLAARMRGPVSPEFEPIRTKFNESVGSLERTIGSVIAAVGTIRVGLGQITVAAGDLSQRTEQQAASLEETVAALSEVVRGINGTAESAQHAQAAAAATQANAEKGGAVVAKAVAAMNEIERSSKEIGKIIGVIDEIAFQTNLLALNAGVEAARAGEAGRGFAVVAQEVRGLAQRSAEAAKEIKNLIATSSSQVEQGVDMVTASGRSLEEIVTGVAQMTAVVGDIAHAAREQAGSLREVSVAADQMDKVTQQNAAMVEETTAAAQSLAEETEKLARLTERFRTSGAPRTRQPAPAKAARSAPVVQMRAVGTGGAAAKPAKDEWAEF